MLTTLEYQSAISQYRRRHLMAWMACMAPVFGFWCASRYINAEQPPNGLVCIVLMLTGVLALAVINRFLLFKDARLKCRACGRPLAAYKSLVIASKSCPRCGSQVLLDTADQAEPSDGAESR
jgi:DNA-directed RNA polymerase subunit RPC12/RpoP